MRLRRSLLTERIGVFKSLPTPVGDISDVKATVSSEEEIQIPAGTGQYIICGAKQKKKNSNKDEKTLDRTESKL